MDTSRLSPEEVDLLSRVYERALSDPEVARNLALQVGGLASMLPVFRGQIVRALDAKAPGADAAEHLLLLGEFWQYTVRDGLSAAQAHEEMGLRRHVGVKAIEKRLTAARRAMGFGPKAPPTKRPK